MATLADSESWFRRTVSTGNAAHRPKVSRRTMCNPIKHGKGKTIGTPTRTRRLLMESLHEIGFRSRAFATSATAATFGVRSLVR